MDPLTALPDRSISPGNPISDRFLSMGIDRFIDACRFVHGLPYGYNTDRDDPEILFKEKLGSCTTKHAVIGTLAAELGLPVVKTIGIYPMTGAIVTGTDRILNRYGLPYVPMVHCFLSSGEHRVDLTEGNVNGKNRPIETFLYTEDVSPVISGKEEYLLYRRALADPIMGREELKGASMKTLLQAREEGLALLKAAVGS
ncbi:MAG: hypothetical protein PVH30_06870 [Desulfobacterales bacterium]|jgi:hypothetical protein